MSKFLCRFFLRDVTFVVFVVVSVLRNKLMKSDFFPPQLKHVLPISLQCFKFPATNKYPQCV